MELKPKEAIRQLWRGWKNTLRSWENFSISENSEPVRLAKKFFGKFLIEDFEVAFAGVVAL